MIESLKELEQTIHVLRLELEQGYISEMFAKKHINKAIDKARKEAINDKEA